jgi:hypothetical protein
MIKYSLFPRVHAAGSGPFGVFLSLLLSTLAFLFPALLRFPQIEI